jgi:hypothetical protein
VAFQVIKRPLGAEGTGQTKHKTAIAKATVVSSTLPTNPNHGAQPHPAAGSRKSHKRAVSEKMNNIDFSAPLHGPIFSSSC